MLKYSIYSDGSSCGRQKGAIGWGWVIVREKEVIAAGSGGAVTGTNNVAELMGALHGISAWIKHAATLPPTDPPVPCSVELVSDSMYVLGLAKGEYSPSKNIGLANVLREACRRYGISTRWVPGHSGELVNEMCDRLAKAGKTKYAVLKESK